MFSDSKYEIQIRDQRSQSGYDSTGVISTGIYAMVYEAGTKTLATLYSDDARTALANPITRTQFDSDGVLVFQSPKTSVDIALYHSDGSYSFYSSVVPQNHLLALNRDGIDKVLVAPFGSETSETDLAVDFPYDSWIYDMGLYVRTIDATETIDVGLLSSETSGDANGLLASISVGTAGWVAPAAATVGSNDTYLSSSTYGALMGSFVAGADTATDVGTYLKFGHKVTGANAVSMSYTASAGSDTGVGEIYAFFKRLR